jgi:hypothetical protein
MVGEDSRYGTTDLSHGNWRLSYRPSTPPQIASRFISTNSLGSPHDHDSCPSEFGRSQKVSHIATAINPIGEGRKINIGGEGETSYLGFEDFVTEKQTFGGPLDRPLISSLPDCCATDICLRSAPLTSLGQREICRIARPGCRLTLASNHQTVIRVTPFMMSIGTVLEYALLSDERWPDEIVWAVLVVEVVRPETETALSGSSSAPLQPLNQPGRSISGNDRRLPDRGGHFVSKVLL